MKYYVKSRKKNIRAGDAVSFVNKLRTTDREEWASNTDYMKAYAQRKMAFDKIDIQHGSEKEFIQSLLHNDLIVHKSNSGISQLWNVMRGSGAR